MTARIVAGFMQVKFGLLQHCGVPVRPVDRVPGCAQEGRVGPDTESIQGLLHTCLQGRGSGEVESCWYFTSDQRGRYGYCAPIFRVRLNRGEKKVRWGEGRRGCEGGVVYITCIPIYSIKCE